VVDGANMVYVYGVISAGGGASIAARGVGDARITCVEHAGLAAITSRLESDALTAARDVRAHWRVLEDAFESVTVLPLRFGTVLEGEAAVREHLLEPNAEELRELLVALEGRVQLNLKAHYNEQVVLREVVSASPAVAELRERVQASRDSASSYGDRIRLGELVAGEVARRRSADTCAALEILGPFAVSAREEEVRGEDAVFSLAFLVDRSGQRDFDEAVGALRQTFGERVILRYVGPLPAYSFVNVDLTTGSAAWA
jgi:Gas vesicle synthesis protein GvpL/GvpF